MNREEAVARIKDHIEIHRYHERNAVKIFEALDMAIKALEQPEQRWIPCGERLPEYEYKQGRKNGTVYDLYPCLVTRYASHSPINPKRIYVAKHYFDGEIFVNNAGDDRHADVLAWMPLPEPYKVGRREDE